MIFFIDKTSIFDMFWLLPDFCLIISPDFIVKKKKKFVNIDLRFENKNPHPAGGCLRAGGVGANSKARSGVLRALGYGAQCQGGIQKRASAIKKLITAARRRYLLEMALRRGLGFSGSPGFQGAQIARYRLTETNTAASTMRAR